MRTQDLGERKQGQKITENRDNSDYLKLHLLATAGNRLLSILSHGICYYKGVERRENDVL